jgi:tetratricopeptide (TPR) repeat protein
MRSRPLAQLVALWSLLALSTGAPSDAFAQEEEARKQYDAGVSAMEAGDCKSAEAHFEKAMALKPHYKIAGNLGACELELKEYREAAEHLHWALKELQSEAGREQEKEALTQMLERSRLQVGSLRVAVSGYGADRAQIALDGAPIEGATDLVFVAPGNHQVTATAPGAAEVRVQVTAAAGETVAVALPLKEAASVAPADGDDGDEEEESGLAYASTAFWSSLGATGLFAIIGTVLLVRGGSLQDDADARRDEIRSAGGDCADDCPELVDMYAEADSNYDGAVGSFVVSGVFLVASGVWGALWLARDDDEAPADAALGPSIAITPQGDGFVGLRGRF